MADVTFTTSNVLIGDSDQIAYVFSGEAITVGEVVFRSGGVDGQYHAVDIDALATAIEDLDGSEYGIALNETGASAQPLAIARSGSVVAYGTGVFATNSTYYGSVNAGGLTADLPASGDYGVIVGVATDSSSLSVRFHASGVTTP